MKYLGIPLVKDLYTKHYKMLFKEIKEHLNRELYYLYGFKDSIITGRQLFPTQSMDWLQS